jgi:hypothetical protein
MPWGLGEHIGRSVRSTRVHVGLLEKSRNATPRGVPLGFPSPIPSPFLSYRAVARFLLQLSAELEYAEPKQRRDLLPLLEAMLHGNKAVMSITATRIDPQQEEWPHDGRRGDSDAIRSNEEATLAKAARRGRQPAEA